MTCIVGIVDSGGSVYIGADSAGVGDNYSLSIRRDRKIMRAGPFLIGFSTSFRMGQLLGYALDPPEPKPGKSLMGFMVTDFVGAVRKCLTEGGFATKTNEREAGGVFLVGCYGRLFCIDDDYQVGERECGYDACGSARDIALGSLHSTDPGDAEMRIRLALTAAADLNAGVRRPFHVEVTPSGAVSA